MEDPALKNRRRKSDAVIFDDTPSPAQPPLKSVKREEDVPANRQGNDDVRNDEEAGRQSDASSEMKEPELVPSSPEVFELRQLLIASKQQNLNVEQQLVSSKQQQLNLEQQLVNASQMLLKWEQQTVKKEEMYQSTIAYCRVCGLEMPSKMDVTNHFLSEEHIAKVRASGASVSRTAISYWANILDDFAVNKRSGLKRKPAGNEAGEPEVVEIARRPTNATVRIDVNNCAHPTNIFRLVMPAAVNAISLDGAVQWVRASFEKCGEKAKKRCEEKRAPFDCRLCGLELPNKLVVTTHFLSEEHIEKVRASGSTVTKTAISNWANMLNNLADWEKPLPVRWRLY